MQNICLYIARFLSACCVYLFIAKANIWLDRADNTLLVFGYRFFILLAPFFFLVSRKWIASLSFLCGTIGVLLWLGAFNFIGTLLFASGIAIGSYVIKYYAVKTPRGAAINAIIFNLGVFLSGLIIIYLPYNEGFLYAGLVLMIITLICSFFIGDKSKEDSQVPKTNFSLSGLKTSRGQAWAIVGVVSGLEFMGMFSILPQLLIYHYNTLPNWYGWVIELSSLTVVLLQGPIMNIMQKLNLRQTLIILTSSMFVTAFPSVFACQLLMGAMIWVFILTLFECAIGYLDTLAVLEGGLLVKESFVGVGMALAVFIARSFEPLNAALIIGSLGIITMLIAIPILTGEAKQITNQETA